MRNLILAAAAIVAGAVYGFTPTAHTNAYTREGVTYVQRGALGADAYVVTNIVATGEGVTYDQAVRIAQGTATNVVTNVVTAAYVEGLGINAGLETNAVRGVIDKSFNGGTNAVNVAITNYLPLTGGTVNGWITVPADDYDGGIAFGNRDTRNFFYNIDDTAWPLGYCFYVLGKTSNIIPDNTPVWTKNSVTNYASPKLVANMTTTFSEWEIENLGIPYGLGVTNVTVYWIDGGSSGQTGWYGIGWYGSIGEEESWQYFFEYSGSSDTNATVITFLTCRATRTTTESLSYYCPNGEPEKKLMPYTDTDAAYAPISAMSTLALHNTSITNLQATTAKTCDITNTVNAVKAEFYDEPLSVNWTVKMENGEMKLYATTNVNMGVLSSGGATRYTNWSTDNLPSGETWAAQPYYDEGIDLWNWDYDGGSAMSEEGGADATTLTFGYGSGFTTTRSVIQ